MGKFGPGKHTLDTENLPILRKFFGIPFGGRNPFFCEVWFVNRGTPLTINWIADSMSHHDADYQTMVPLVASGQYGLRIENAERFLIKLVGAEREFTAAQLTNHFQGELSSKTKTAILQFMMANRIGFKNVNAYLATISDALKGVMGPFWEDYGFSLTGFYINSIDLDTQTPVGRTIADAIAHQSKQLITGSSYQQERMFQIAEQAAKGGGGGLLGAIMMTNMIGSGQGIMQPVPPMIPGATGPIVPSAALPTPMTARVAPTAPANSGAIRSSARTAARSTIRARNARATTIRQRGGASAAGVR